MDSVTERKIATLPALCSKALLRKGAVSSLSNIPLRLMIDTGVAPIRFLNHEEP